MSNDVFHTYYADDHQYWMDRKTNKLHRLNGPAVITADNIAYYLYGTWVSKEKWKEYLINHSGLTTNEITRILLEQA
jgi:hypothetical protein